MSIDEMQNLRAAAENRLAQVAAQLVEEFQRATNLKVDGIYFDLRDISTIGGPERSIVEGARLDVRL